MSAKKSIKYFLCVIFYFVFIMTCSKEPTRPLSDNPFDPTNPATGGDPFRLQAQIANGGITLSWNKPTIQGLAGFRVYRSEQESSGYSVIATVNQNTTQHVDQTVLNGHSYWYRVSAVNSTNVETDVTNTAAVNIKTDPLLVINGGAQYTAIREVSLTILANTAQQMMLANTADFQNATWESYTTSKTWMLLSGEGSKTVYMKVRYGDGSESPVVSESILPQPMNPAVIINNNDVYTASREVILQLIANGALQMYISNYPLTGDENTIHTILGDQNIGEVKILPVKEKNKDEKRLNKGIKENRNVIQKEIRISTKSDGWEAFNSTKVWMLSTGSGTKTVYAKFRNDFEIESEVVSDDILPKPMNPGIVIAGGAQYTATRNVQLTLSATGSNLTMKISQDSTFTGLSWQTYTSPLSFELSTGSGTKTVYTKFRNDFEMESEVVSDDILPQPMDPGIVIAGGAQYTATRNVQLTLSATGRNLTMKVSQDSTFSGLSWQTYTSPLNFELSAGSGTKTVYARFRNDFEIESEIVNSSIILDLTPPVPILSVSPDSGITGETNFQFDPTASSDNLCPVNDLQIRFDWENNGNWTGWSNLKITGHQYSVGGGNKTVKMEVRDGAGWTADTTVNLFVNTRPVAQFTATQNSNNLLLLHFDASASHDYEDGTNLQFRWDWENNGIWDTQFSNINTISHQYTSWGNISAKLEVKDTGNLENTCINSVLVSCIDFDGNIYQVVKIGNQWWMAENLKVTHYRDNTPIPNLTDNTAWSNDISGAYCNYGNNPANVSTYGRLYNWYAVNNSHGLAPAGWHVPSDAEWETLVNYLGGASIAGGAMKETGTAHWTSPNTGATNSSGFTALPGGYRNEDGSFLNVGINAYFWSATELNTGSAWNRGLYFGSAQVVRGNDLKRNGFSVRCVRD